jgi:hypothetical protein
MTRDQVQTAGRKLMEKGIVVAEKHQIGGIQDHTYSYRVAADTPDAPEGAIESAEQRHLDSAERRNLPSIKTEKTTTHSARATGLPKDWSPSNAHAALAFSLGADLAFEADKFRDWVASDGVTKKDWEATFRNWLRNARPRQRAGAPPATRNREQEIRDLMSGSLGLDNQKGLSA